MKGFTDLHDLEEDERIQAIGQATMGGSRSSADKPLIIAFIVDDYEKADRYMEKLEKNFPGIRLIDKMNGPVKDSVLVRVGPPLR